ncbi:MAG: PD-(D/E)XK motif protein, partial [Phocaeicola sp.]
MDAYKNELKSKWNSINYHTGGSLQLSVKHPLDWYVRYATPEQKSVVIISDCPLDNLASSKSIEAACNQRKDGKYAISFALLDRHQEDVFITMSCDIIEFSCVDKPNMALAKVLRRYAAWLKLFDHKHSVLLGINAQKGLIGELLFLKEQIELDAQPTNAVLGWVGPDGADQDFVYNDGWHEIKSTGVSSTN